MNSIKMKVEISEKDYDELARRNMKEVADYVLNIACQSTFHPCGYGFYSPIVYKEDGKCYASWGCYDSCD